MKNYFVSLSEKQNFMAHVDDVLAELTFDVKDFEEKLSVKIVNVKELEAFTADHLKAFIDEQRNQLLGNVKFVPKSIRDSFDDQFNRTYNDALKLVTECQKRLKELKNMGIEAAIVDGKVTADKKHLETRATEFATVHFSEQQMRYAGLIADAAKALKNVADFEKAQGLPHIDLDKRLQPLSYKFNEAVFFGLIAEQL